MKRPPLQVPIAALPTSLIAGTVATAARRAYPGSMLNHPVNDLSVL
jgi:hypothetical protein